MKKQNPFYLTGPDACRKSNPQTECEFRNSSKVLESELLPDQHFCDLCRCKLLDYVPPPEQKESTPSWLKHNSRWVALGMLVGLGLLWFFLRKPEPPKITQQCDGYNLYEYIDGKKGRLLAKNSKTGCGYIEPVPIPEIIPVVKPVKKEVKPAKKKLQPPGTCQGGEWITYTYDASGNRTGLHNTHQPCR